MTSSLFDRDRPHDVREGLFGGRGAVRVWNLAAVSAPFSALLACELEPRGSVGAHVQQESAELVIALSGIGTVTVDGHTHPFATGSVAQLPLGQSLAITNESGQEPLRYFIVKARP